MSDEKILDKVAKLIQAAEDFSRHGEQGSAEAALARADAIMTKYAIDRAMLAATQRKTGNVREEPVSVAIPFVISASDFSRDFSYMFRSVMNHCRVQYVLKRRETVLFGFETDVEYAQMMWTSVHLAFASKINPSWNENESADYNIKVMKEAGIKWKDIAADANKYGFPCTATDGRLKTAYRRQCAREGVQPTSHTQRHSAYRASYAEAFSNMIADRLLQMREAGREAMRDTPGSEIALRDRAQDVREKMYQMFPHLRPTSPEDRKARLRQWEEEEAHRLNAMTPAQRRAEEARQERDRSRRQAKYERDEAMWSDRAGRKAGEAAAQEVDLGVKKVGSKEWSGNQVERVFGDSLRIE